MFAELGNCLDLWGSALERAPSTLVCTLYLPYYSRRLTFLQHLILFSFCLPAPLAGGLTSDRAEGEEAVVTEKNLVYGSNRQHASVLSVPPPSPCSLRHPPRSNRRNIARRPMCARGVTSVGTATRHSNTPATAMSPCMPHTAWSHSPPTTDGNATTSAPSH